MSDNIDATAADLAFIRSLPDFDLIMLLSEINDHGWEEARKLLPLMAACHVAEAGGAQ